MQHATDTHQTTDGLSLHLRQWTPDVETKAVVLLVHGVHEHGGRYAYAASALMARGIAVHAFDLRGHGRSGGPRAEVLAFGEYVDDLAEVLVRTREAADGLPLFLMGHSMGGLVAAAYVVEHGPGALSGLVLSSPALQIPDDTSPLLRKLAPVVARWAPRFPASRLNLSHLSRDAKVAEAYRTDPLVTVSPVRARLGYEIVRTTEAVREHPEAFTLPLYLFHGTADRITDPAGSRWLYEHAPAADKTLRLYEGYYHETLNEPERDEVIAELAAWITERA